MLLSPIFRAFQLIKGHTKCFSDILITIDHSTCSLWYLIQSALNQSALNQIQGRLKKVTFLFKADLKIFVRYIEVCCLCPTVRPYELLDVFMLLLWKQTLLKYDVNNNKMYHNLILS